MHNDFRAAIVDQNNKLAQIRQDTSDALSNVQQHAHATDERVLLLLQSDTA